MPLAVLVVQTVKHLVELVEDQIVGTLITVVVTTVDDSREQSAWEYGRHGFVRDERSIECPQDLEPSVDGYRSPVA